MMPLAIQVASVTDFIVDPIVDVATEFIDSVGLIGVFILMLLESACIPVPSEAIMLFAGFNVSEGDLTMFGIIAGGSPGERRRLLDCVGGRLLRADGAAREEPAYPHQPEALGLG